MFRHLGDQEKQEEQCVNRVNANFTAALHILCSSAYWLVMSSSEGGAGFDLLAAMRLEFTWQEVCACGFIAVASIITLFQFATRESVSEDIADMGRALSSVFILCWLLAILTLVFNTKTVHASRTRRRDELPRESNHAIPGRNWDGSETSSPAAVEVLPFAWSCVMVSLSLFGYTVPQTIRWMAHIEWLRVALGALSNMAFVSHMFMLSTREHSSAQKISVAHCSLHLVGVLSSSMATANALGVTVGWAVFCLVDTFAVVFELWVWTRVLRPYLASYNRKLLNELPITIFRWLFANGGLTLCLYCYFEALGAGLEYSSSPEDAVPWLIANSVTITHFTLAAALTTTIIADAGTSASTILRGKAPLYASLGFAAVMFTSLIPLALFAGREFSDRRQGSVYSAADAAFVLLWVGMFTSMAYGHSSPRTNRRLRSGRDRRGRGAQASGVVVEDAGNSADRGASKGSEDPVTGARSKRLSASLLAGGAALSAGV